MEFLFKVRTTACIKPDPFSLSIGITGGFGGDRRVEYIIPAEAKAQGIHEFVIESSCNGMFGVPWNGDTIAPPDVNMPSFFVFNCTHFKNR